VVWYVTGGPAAIGELAIVALTIAVLMPESLRRGASDNAYALTVGVLASAAAMTKLSTVPIAAFLLVAGAAHICRGKLLREAIGLCVVALAPIVVLWGPLVVWSWHRTGAPLGPFLSWWFPHSVYAATPVHDMLSQAANTTRHALTLPEVLFRHSPLLLLGAVGA